jgi:hypothetical protein
MPRLALRQAYFEASVDVAIEAFQSSTVSLYDFTGNGQPKPSPIERAVTKGLKIPGERPPAMFSLVCGADVRLHHRFSGFGGDRRWGSCLFCLVYARSAKTGLT